MSPTGLPIFCQSPSEADLRADGAGGVLDHRQAVGAGDRHQRGEVAGHADLVDGEDRLGPRGDRGRDGGDVDVVAAVLDVDEDRHAAALADGVRRGDEGVADRHHLVARPDADGEEREVQRGGAVRDGAGVGGADVGGELGLEGGDLRPLGEPAGEDDGGGGLGLLGAEDGLGDRDHERASRAAAAVSARHQATRSRDALVEGQRRAEAEVGGRGGAGGEAARHRVDRALGLVDGHEVGPAHGAAERAGEVEERGLGLAADVVDPVGRLGLGGEDVGRGRCRGRGSCPWSAGRRRR